MATTIHHTGRYLQLRDEDGWEYCTRTNATAAVVVVAHTPDGLLLVEQHRPPVGRRVIELPAGLAGDQGPEELATAALRELEEETGWSAGRFTHVGTGPSSAGLTDEQIAIFVAHDLVRTGPGGGDDTEDITVHAVPLARVVPFLRAREAAGHLVDPKVWAGLFWAFHPELVAAEEASR